MLPKNYRIQKKNEISSLLQSKRRLSSTNFGLGFSSTLLPNFRLLVVVSKKISKKAVVRNLIRRRIQSVFASLKSKDRLPSGLDCSIIVRRSEIQKLDYDQLLLEITTACRRLSTKNY